jgi:pimeloyl-ACP methyl ester carboxylesterase
MNVPFQDDELVRFEAEGAWPGQKAKRQGTVKNDGARIWYAVYGQGPQIILLHGGLGHSGNWSYQIPFLVELGMSVITIDSRGHGRSTHDGRPYRYEMMVSDVVAVMDKLRLPESFFVGWSDGAVVALMLAHKMPQRVAALFFFGGNMDPGGAKEITELTPIMQRCLSRHRQDYARLSATPHRFDAFAAAVGLMQATQPTYTADDLAQIRVPVAIVQSQHDELIKYEHAVYLYNTIPDADFMTILELGHFAPLQRPDQFNRAMLAALRRLSTRL